MFRELDFNKFEYLPWSKYATLPPIKSMKPIQQIPLEEMKRIMEEDKDLLQENRNVKNWIQTQISTRVVVLGAPGSGKTTFIQLVRDQSNFPTKDIPTDGISIQNVNNITFWDFGGQEVFFSTHKFFLADRCQYIIVVNLSHLIHEKEKIRNECLKYIDFWMKEIHSFTLNQRSPPVLFLGTHCDLIDNFLDLKSKITKGTKLLLELAKSNHLNCIPKVFKFYKSSRQITLHSNISGILKQIKINSENFIEKDLSLSSSNDHILNSLLCLSLKQEIEQLREKKPFMVRNKFEKIFFDNESQENIHKFTKLLKFSGIIETYRFESSAASEIIFLDPKWLSETFTSIVSIQLTSSKNRRGFFTSNQIENNFKKQNIPQSIWQEIISIFEIFHLIALLPSGEYYVPAMLHTPKSSQPSHLGNKKRELIINAFKEKNIKYKCIRRKYEFSPQIPFGFIDKLIVKYLHFPGITMHESTWTNDFYLVSNEDENYNYKFYHILIQLVDVNSENNYFMNKELMISLYFPENEAENFYFSFFCHFLFQSPHDIASSSIHLTSSIEKIFIFEENENTIGEEKDLLFNFNKNLHLKQYFLSSNIKTFDSDVHKCKIIEKLGSGEFGQVFSGKMIFNPSSKIKISVVFKETKFLSFDSLRKLINECMMMKIVENQFTIKLHGICIPTMRFLESRKKNYLTDVSSPSNQTFNEEEYLNHQMLMIIEEAPWGDLRCCHEIIHEKNSMKLKLKIAFDVARGLHSLYLIPGVKLIHRDVKAENIFIFSLDENSVSKLDSVHAKLGDFGSIIIASSSCSQRIENYQYAAPEALRESFLVPYSKEIDVYSFGILFWEILTGKIPFQELEENPETRDNIEKMIIEGYRPSLDILPVDTPPCIIEIIKDCWNSKPSSRPSLGKIISILTIILQLDIFDEQEIKKLLPSVESNFELKQQIIGSKIGAS